jgi:hypothetical protein
MPEQTADKIKEPDALVELIARLMPDIDAWLGQSDVRLPERLLSAATLFVDEIIIEVRYGDTVEDKGDSSDYVARPWFAVIYHHIENWYREHYGEALHANESGRAHGFVLVRNLPVELIVPLTRSRVETPGETAWLSFPKEVESDEDPLAWLGKSPNIAALHKEDKKALVEDAREIATALRSIRVNSAGIEPSDDVMYGLLNGVPAEFESAARTAVRSDAAGLPGALWNIHLAVERALKAFNQHKTGTFREIHDLFYLFDDVAGYGIAADRNLLKKLRRDSDVIANRYGLGVAPTLREVFAAYKAGLIFVSSVVQSFERKVNMGGASFLLGKPPWTSLPPTTPDGQG